MNKVRIIGLVLLVIGLVLKYFLESYNLSMLRGLLIGLGIGMLLTGRIKKP